MSDILKKLAAEAGRLPPDERARLAEHLLESLREAPIADVELAWEREIAERVAAYDRSKLATFSAEDVVAEARRLAR